MEAEETGKENNSDELESQSIDEADSARETEDRKKVEAALFISGRFLDLKELVALTDVNPILLRKILSDLGDRYMDSAINIVKRDNMWKMDVASDYVGVVNKLATGSSEFTRAEQETLAIIAHKQPVKQSTIVKIRGNKAYDHIKNFTEMGLINKKKIGHTAELTLSDDFYNYFHVSKGKSESLQFKEGG